MKRGLLITALAMMLGIAGYFLVRWQRGLDSHFHAHDYARHDPDGHHAELDWMRSELKVTDAQMEKVRALHVAYHPVCGELTRRLENSHRRLQALTSSATDVSPEIQAALREHGIIHQDCQEAMLRHFYETAACLSPEQARIYLDKMLPFVLLHDAIGAGEHRH